MRILSIIPNSLTILRLLITPITLWLIMANENILAISFFIIAALTDALDGFIARFFNAHSRLGKLLDPLADKALLVGCYVLLGYLESLPLWLVGLVVLRDVAIILCFVANRPLFWLEAAPFKLSKINTALQAILIGFVLCMPISALTARLCAPVVRFLIPLVAYTTVSSGLAYLMIIIRTRYARLNRSRRLNKDVT